jgi:hypothetical protein
MSKSLRGPEPPAFIASTEKRYVPVEDNPDIDMFD